nr:hypothetical protein [Pseudoflavonifractor sp. BIOML-A9]
MTSQENSITTTIGALATPSMTAMNATRTNNAIAEKATVAFFFSLGAFFMTVLPLKLVVALCRDNAGEAVFVDGLPVEQGPT